MIFDITVNNAEYTHLLKKYFEFENSFIMEIVELGEAREVSVDIALRKRELYDELQLIKYFIATNQLGYAHRKFIKHVFESDYRFWVENTIELTDKQKEYILANLKITMSKKFKIKNQNDTHLYAYTAPYNTKFVLIQ